MVMGDNSCSERSWVRILALFTGLTFFLIDFFVKLYCLFEKTENKRKEAGVGPFKKS